MITEDYFEVQREQEIKDREQRVKELEQKLDKIYSNNPSYKIESFEDF